MTPGETTRLFAALGAEHQKLMQQYREGNVARLHEQMPGLRAANFDGAHGAPGTVSDPTGQQATGSDPVVSDELYLTDALRGAHALLTQAVRLLGAYHAPGAPDERAKLELARDNRKVEPGCKSCARTDQAKGVPRWSPPASHTRGKPTRGPKGPDGVPILAEGEAQLLCRWCYDRLGLWGRLPTPGELAVFHEQGERRVPWPKDVPHPDRTRRPA